MTNQTPITRSIKREVSNRVWETKSYLRYLLYRRRGAAKTRFILITRARSGSHLLMNMLNAHPDIHVDNESVVLGYRKHILFPQQYIAGLSARNSEAVYGCKVNLIKLKDHGMSRDFFFRKFHEDGWRFIHLRRQNVYRQTISSLIASNRQIYHDRNKDALSDFSFDVDIPKMLEFMDTIAERDALEIKFLSKYPSLEVVYERDLLSAEKHQATMERIFTFLEVPLIPIQADLVKTTPTDLSKIITNYDQVVEAVRNSSHAALLEQD